MFLSLKKLWVPDSDTAKEFLNIQDIWNRHNRGDLPWDRIVTSGGFTTGTRSVSAATTLTGFDQIVFLDASAAFTVTLPASTGLSGRQYILKVTTGTKNIKVVPSGSETIDGSTHITLPGAYFSAMIFSNGSNWFVL